MTHDTPDRYTITAGRAAEILKLTRMAVILMAMRGDLSYREKPRGRMKWRFFDPDEVARLAFVRDGNQPEQRTQ